jgi:hypothetical protein
MTDPRLYADLSSEICPSDRVKRRGGFTRIGQVFGRVNRRLHGGRLLRRGGSWLRNNPSIRRSTIQRRRERRARMERKYEQIEVKINEM